MSPWRLRAARLAMRVGGFIGVLLVLVASRVLLASHAELASARQAQGIGDDRVAIVHFRRAAAWHAPFSPLCVEALDALASIARGAEERDDSERALQAWRAIHAAVHSSRSVGIPHGAALSEADARIRELTTGFPGPGDPKDSRPLPLWTFLGLLGFFLWVAAAFMFSQRAVDEEGHWVPSAGRLWAAVFAFGLVAFVVGLAMA